jgi:GNAT superfamily N-acetyltransferase
LSSITYRPFRPEDLPGAFLLSQEAGWPHRLADWQLALAVGEGIVAVDEQGQIAATGLVWFYGDNFATLGLMIVSSRHRSKGIGRAVMDRLLGLAGGRSILLHATTDGQPLYEKLGFEPTGHIYQHQGEVAAVTATGPAPRVIRKEDLPSVLALDTQAFGAPRAALIGALATAGEAVVIEANNEIVAASFRRPFGRGTSIGPLIAGDLRHARRMIEHWTQGAPRFVRVDLTSHGETLGDLLTERGMPRVSKVLRMVRPGKGGGDPLTEKCLSLVAQALG